MTYEGRPLLKSPKMANEQLATLLNVLKEPEDRVRYRARIELANRDTTEVIKEADRWVAALDKNDPNYEHHRLEGLWLHQSHNVVDEALLVQVLTSPDFRARAAATRVLCYWRDRVPDALELFKTLAADEHPRVRLEAVRGASFFKSVEALDVALAALKQPSDYYLDYALSETLRQLSQALETLRNVPEPESPDTDEVLRPVLNPWFAAGAIDIEHVDALRARIVQSGPVLAGTAAWFLVLKKERRRAGITDGNPQDLYFQRCYELASEHGHPQPRQAGSADGNKPMQTYDRTA